MLCATSHRATLEISPKLANNRAISFSLILPMSAEIQRRLANIIRFGTIAEVNHATARARVKSGEILTDFLPFVTMRAGTTKTWSPPTVGEQCIVLAVNGEFTTACVLVGLYTQNSPSHSPDEHLFEFADGAKIIYNQATGALSVTGIQTASIQAEGQIDIECPTVNIHGDLNISGNVTSAGDMNAGGISLQNHVHTEQGDGKKTSKAQ